MDLNPIHIIYRWINKRAAIDAENARRQRNLATTEARRARRRAGRDARQSLEEQGFVVVEKEEYEGLRRQLQQAQEENRSLKRQLESGVSKEEYEASERRLVQANNTIAGLQQQLGNMLPRTALDRQRTRTEEAESTARKTVQQYQAIEQKLTERIQEFERQLGVWFLELNWKMLSGSLEKKNRLPQDCRMSYSKPSNEQWKLLGSLLSIEGK